MTTSILTVRPLHWLRSLALVAPLMLVACASPTDADPNDADSDEGAAVNDSLSTQSLRPIYRPDFVAIPHEKTGGCRDENNKYHYRFYLKNQGNAASTVPMTKIHIWAPWAPGSALPDYTTYAFNTSLAAGETKLIDLVIPFSMYPTTYEAVVQPDVANVVKEWNESNNDFVKNTAFQDPHMGPPNCS